LVRGYWVAQSIKSLIPRGYGHVGK